MANKKPTKKITTKKHLAREHREARQTRLILTVTIVVGTIVLGLLIYGIIDQTLIRPRTPVAKVGETTITAREFTSYVQYSRVQLLNQSFQYFSFYQQFGEFGASFLQNAQTIAMQLNQPISFGRDILDEMIDNQIIRDEAAKRGISVSQAEIDEAIQAAFGFFPDGTPTPTVTATIQPTPTLSETQLALVTLTPTETATPEENIEEPPAPLEENDVEDQALTEPEVLEEELTEPAENNEELDDLQEQDLELTATPEVTPTITITPTPYTEELFKQNIRDFNNLYAPYNFDINDLRAIFEVQLLRERLIEELSQDLEPVKLEVWARHILVETLDEALEVLALLEEGEDFHTLARTYSLDESNRDEGGDLGWFDQNTMVMEFTEAAFSLAEGEISEPVETTFGFHIIQVLGKRESQVSPEEFQTQKQTLFVEWLTEVRNNRGDIVVFDAWDKHVPSTPEVPPQFLAELFQQQQVP